MTIDRLTARNAARTFTAHDEHNFGQAVRQANPGASRRAEAQRQTAEARTQSAEAQARRAMIEEQTRQAQAAQRELQEQAALEREQRQAHRPQVPQQMPNTPRLS
jgi:hypothetical protein